MRSGGESLAHVPEIISEKFFETKIIPVAGQTLGIRVKIAGAFDYRGE